MNTDKFLTMLGKNLILILLCLFFTYIISSNFLSKLSPNFEGLVDMSGNTIDSSYNIVDSSNNIIDSSGSTPTMSANSNDSNSSSAFPKNVIHNTVNILLNDVSREITSPSPFGDFSIYTYTTQTSKKYPFKLGKKQEVVLNFDASGITVIKIEPDSQQQSTVEQDNIFPVKTSVILTFDDNSPLYTFTKEKSNESGDKNKLIKNSLGNNEINIIRTGNIYDNNLNQIGSVTKGMMNPGEYTINITNTEGLSRISMQLIPI
jgi:hypothetical protein